MSTTATKAPPTSFTDRSDPDYKDRVIGEVVTLAREIQAWQEKQVPALPNESLVKRFPRLGSTRTYRRILASDFTTLNPEAQLANYRIVWNKIKTLSGVATEEIYEDLNPAVEIQLAIAGVVQEHGKERLVIVEGPTGSGKTEGLKLAARQFPGSVGIVEANECWRSPREALGDMLVATAAVINEEDIPKTTGACLRQLITHLNRQRMALAIDEGHHMSARVINLIKTILNKTDSIVIIATIDTIWRKLTAKHWPEARQLIHNRSYARVILTSPTEDDTITFLSRRVQSWDGSDWKRTATKIATMAKNAGDFAFLRRVANELNKAGHKLTASDLMEAANRIAANFKTRK